MFQLQNMVIIVNIVAGITGTNLTIISRILVIYVEVLNISRKSVLRIKDRLDLQFNAEFLPSLPRMRKPIHMWSKVHILF